MVCRYWATPARLLLPCTALHGETIKAAVIRSQGTMFLGMTIWDDLNTGWSNFGVHPVSIDYTSLAGYGWGLAEIQATGADVLIFSVPGFLNYSTAEIAAIKQYVEEGHGLIITYDDFLGPRKALAPLVGLSEDIKLGTNSWPESPQFDVYDPGHPVFREVTLPYVTGSGALASPTPGHDWVLTSNAVVVSRATPEFMGFSGNGVIVANETDSYRGLYFANYVENKSGGGQPTGHASFL